MIGTKFSKGIFDSNSYAEAAKWCNANNATIVDKGTYYEVIEITITLEEAKSSKIAELKAERDEKEVQPITYGNNTFDYDEKARERINAAIIALDVQGADASIDWTTADNQDVKVTANDLRMVIAMVAQRSNALHVAYRAAKDKVEAATTVAEVEVITLDA